MTVAMYLQSVAEGARTFAPIKSASAAIAFYQKVNNYGHLPTRSPAVGMVRQAAGRRLGLGPKSRKEPFQWAQVVSFARTFGLNSRGYCHLVVASMAVLMYGAMCRYNDVSRLWWRDLRWDVDGSCIHITFSRRKNCQYRQGNVVSVAAAPQGPVCPLNLLRKMMGVTNNGENAFVFRGFNGRHVITSPERTSPGTTFISYAQFSKYLALWFGESLGLTAKEFLAIYGSQSGRSGAASATSNAGVQWELWGQHGDWKSEDAQRAYMKRDSASVLSVSRAAMTPVPPVASLTPGVLAAPSPSPAPLLLSAAPHPPVDLDDEEQLVEGIPPGSFAWHSPPA
jgi:hypothetical protein